MTCTPLLLVVATVASGALQDHVAAKMDHTPRTYSHVCEYSTLSPDGKVAGRRLFEATYQTDPEPGHVWWNAVTMKAATGEDGPYGELVKFDFMNGLGYTWEESREVGKAKAFQKIPDSRVEVRNLLWDTHMFESFAHNHLANLKLNVPFVIRKNRDASLAGSGNFHDTAIDLTWIGDSEWNGRKCALIRYRAFLNRFDYTMGTLKTVGSSDYWGEIWLAKATNRIEHATLYESVTVRVGTSSSSIRVFRVAALNHTPK